MTRPGKINLLIADDHPVARSGIKGQLAGTEINVVADVASGRAAVKYVLEHRWTWCLWMSACPRATV